MRTKVLSVTSGKGGVGKTTTSINLALALSHNGNRVLILDADLGLANVNVMLGFQSGKTIDDVLDYVNKVGKEKFDNGLLKEVQECSNIKNQFQNCLIYETKCRQTVL